mmetsp:Transcript_13132/g.29884  ORF Transcript_13132/g.29884 Transcript_13132/m.29884 type:complete len:136 (+) Transcript_13132:59-466(+)
MNPTSRSCRVALVVFACARTACCRASATGHANGSLSPDLKGCGDVALCSASTLLSGLPHGFRADFVGSSTESLAVQLDLAMQRRWLAAATSGSGVVCDDAMGLAVHKLTPVSFRLRESYGGRSLHLHEEETAALR